MFSKKSAVAAAVLLASVAAQAQVTVYGNVDAFFGRIEAPVANADATTNVESGVHTGSFIGFKGQEDLGGGLKAFFALESDILVDEGRTDGNFWGRTSELGLAGDFGTIKLGNSRSLGFLANAAYNPFPVTGWMNASEGLNGFGNYTDAVTYMSPNLSGFTLAAQVGMSEEDEVDNSFGLSANYNAGPLAVGFNYSTQEVGIGGLLAQFGFNETDVNDLLVDLGVDPSITGDYDRWQLGASYDFGVAKAFAQYGQNKLKGEGESTKTKFYQLGVTVPVSAQGTFMASFANLKASDFDLSARDISVVYDHALSKRTSAYVGLKNVRIKFDGESESGNTFGVGVKHAF